MANYRLIMQTPTRGFTLIEMLVVLAIIGILATMAFPSMQAKMVREQIETITSLTDVAKKPIGVYWALTKMMPRDNQEAGLPIPEKMVSNVVKKITITNGVIDITFGNQAHPALQGKVLTMRPAVVPDTPLVPITWLCGGATTPENMTAIGNDNTNIAPAYLPLSCQKRGNPKH